MRVAVASCADLPEPDADAGLLFAELRANGVDAELVAWDRPGADFGSFDACVIRSTWNYHHHTEAFLTWVDRTAVATRLHNPAAIVRWNHHKRYLQELHARGVPVVPTRFVARGDQVVFGELCDEQGWSDVIVKPAVSAASFRTRRFSADQRDDGERFLAALGRDRDAMVQPYLRSVETDGERALIQIAGEWTHAVRKQPRFGGGAESVSTGIEIEPDELQVAERALEAVGVDLLYARVDLIRDTHGQPVVSELELIEPSLYLLQHPPAATRLAAAMRGLGA